MTKFGVLLLIACALQGDDWSAPAEVLHDFKPCVTYRAKLDGDVLLIQASIEPGWHTFAIDNERRAAEKLAGKQSLGIDQPTQITLRSGLAPAGPWYQTPPKDFSKPELRWFSWGFEQQAIFAAKVKRSGGPVQIGIRGQACTETTCKNVDVTLSLRAAETPSQSSVDWSKLVQVR